MSWCFSDVPRTFPNNIYFQGPTSSAQQNALFNVLVAVAHSNPDIGYCQVNINFLINYDLPSVLWLVFSALTCLHYLDSVGVRKGFRPVKKWVVRCWRGYLSGLWSEVQRVAYGPADANATSSSLALLKSRMAVPFCCRLTEVVLEKRLLNGLSVWWLTNYYF